MAYTTVDNPELYFQTKLYTGDGNSSKAITLDGDENMQPNWVWIKSRSTADYDHMVTDSVRGTQKTLKTNTTGAEDSNPGAGGIGSFDSDGFTIAEGSINNTNMNNSGTTYVAWNWKESATAGFDIVAYTGTGSSNAVSHSLSATPSMIIIKNRDDADSWYVWHQSLGAVASNYINLDTTGAKSSVSDGITAISSSNFTVNTRGDVNASSEKYIAYCFAQKQGFSKFGSYTGNGDADGSFIYTGFKPAWVMIKATSATGSWNIADSKRSPENEVDEQVQANLSNAESTSFDFDFTSNGFKARTTDAARNGSGVSYIFMAFAESPFVTGASGIPTTAR